jgi:gas vesicle protein
MSRADRAARKAAKRGARRGRGGGFLFGLGAGIIAGLLLAPKSGKETRQQLLGDAGLSGQMDRLKDAVGAGKESAGDQSEALKRKIEETRERLRREMDGAGAAVGGAEATTSPES